MADNKKRHVVSYEKMPLNPELAAAFAEKYPRGFSDYLTDLVKYPKPDGTSFYAVTVEIPDAAPTPPMRPAKPCPTTTSPSTAAAPTTNKPWKTRLSNTSGAR